MSPRLEAGRARGAGGVRSFRSSDADRKLKEGNREALQREEEVIWVLYQLSVCVVCGEQLVLTRAGRSPCRTSPGCCAQSQPLPVEPPRVLGVAESIRAEVYPGLFTVLLAVMKPNWALLKFCCDI